LTTSTEAPESPLRLRWADWIAVFKRASNQFVTDDCMGLSQQIAYSSLLAFFHRVKTRPLWKVRLIAIVLVGLTGLVMAGLFLLIVFGGPLGEAIADQANLGGAFDLLWDLLRWPLTFVAILLFFAILYYLAPDPAAP
jgi:uncharacterized BrkB/YihY/UPF0761 family membrane protein